MRYAAGMRSAVKCESKAGKEQGFKSIYVTLLDR
jgi:hypothetical protein